MVKNGQLKGMFLTSACGFSVKSVAGSTPGVLVRMKNRQSKHRPSGLAFHRVARHKQAMAKIGNMVTQAQWEGAEAAASGRGRSTNPFPQSDIGSRNEWFQGYDQKIEQMSRLDRKPRIRDF
jgi:hypothetical protein